MQNILWVARQRLAGLMLMIAAGSILTAAAAQTTDSTNATRPPAPRRPSIILIVADGLGYGDLGCYGQTKIKTPNIDKLAAEGLRFTSFYAGAASGPASRCALLTGLHTGHFADGGDMTLPSNAFTIGELLQQAGYRTGFIGEWGLGGENSTSVPWKKGFEEYVGSLTENEAQDYYAPRLWRYEPRTHYEGDVVFPENEGGKKGAYIPDMLSQAMANFAKINKPEQFNHYRSFFVMVTTPIPRSDTIQAKRSGNGMEVPSHSDYADETWSDPEKDRAAMITRLDEGIGKLMEQLKKMKMEENTIVILTSSTGPEDVPGVDPKTFASTGALRGAKGSLYEGGIRVPFVARCPGQLKQGVNDTPWALWDVLPTATEMARTVTPDKIDGISLLPALFGKTQTNQHAFLYWQKRGADLQQAARMNEWKAIRTNATSAIELYNLKRDIAEKANVAAQNPKVVEKFSDLFKSFLSSSAPKEARVAEQASAQGESRENKR